MHFVFSESAKKDIFKLPKPDQKRLKKKFLFWQETADPLVFAKALSRHQEATHRFRLGSYRILVKTRNLEIVVLRIRHRKDVYKR